MGIDVSLRVEECECSRHVQMLLLFQIPDNDMPLIYSHNISWFHLRHLSYFRVKGNYASSTRRAMAFFFLSNNKPFRRVVLYTEETIKTSAIAITRATKFIAMLRLFHFDTKPVPWIIFLLEKICCRAGSKETFLKVGTLSVQARAYPREIKTNNMNFKNAAISPL